ncbi:hypothetical protein [Capnocytophaga gingivalis]|uniref:hypothetical protein n=1 Tax=Capnocytophaga gingivalis TaxID=1017 RepID=UPI0028E97702|nr:hypothetical protein [Capnocytophaga gingivalis]
MANKTLHAKISLTSFKEFSPDETPSWVINVIISDTDKEYSKFSEPIFEILQPRAEKAIFELKNPIQVRDVSFIEEEDDTISYHLWDKINELVKLKGKGATLRAIVKDLDGNEYASNEINIDDFFI